MDINDFTPSFPQSIDSTMLTCFDSCPQRFFNEYCVRISPSGISPDLHAGGAIAQGFETIRTALYRDNLPLIEALGAGYISFTKFWGAYEPPIGHPKTYVNSFCAIVDYFRQYPPHEDPLQPYRTTNGAPALEFNFGIPLSINHPQTGDPILFSGRFDMLAKNTHANNTLCILDEKTTKSFYKNWARQWIMRGQFFGYIWAAQYYGLPCDHFCVRGIAIQKTQYQHLQHGPAQVPAFLIERWHHWMLWKIQEMVDHWKDMESCAKAFASEWDGEDNPHQYWPQSFGEACTNYGGCSYTGICTQPDPRRWYYDFERRIWDPLAKNPTGASDQPLADLAGMTLADLEARGAK